LPKATKTTTLQKPSSVTPRFERSSPSSSFLACSVNRDSGSSKNKKDNTSEDDCNFSHNFEREGEVIDEKKGEKWRQRAEAYRVRHKAEYTRKNGSLTRLFVAVEGST
jgi:hypothetical protein